LSYLKHRIKDVGYNEKLVLDGSMISAKLSETKKEYHNIKITEGLMCYRNHYNLRKNRRKRNEK
jgi:hypothetical protein